MTNKKHKKKIDSLFDPSKIKMDSKIQSIYSLMSRVKHNEIETSSYQRGDVWNDQAKSRLIESIIVRIPIPVFYIDASNENSWKIIDGLQRITSLKEFMVDKTLKLIGLEYILDLDGYSFDELPRLYQRRLEETNITIIFLNAGTPENVKYNIFKRINTGGLPLSNQEIRHALNDGVATSLLKELSHVVPVSEIWGSTRIWKSKKDRMEKNELVLRGLGYWFVDWSFIQEKNLDEYLIEAMKNINKSSKENRELKINNFFFAYNACLKIMIWYLGKYHQTGKILSIKMSMKLGCQFFLK